MTGTLRIKQTSAGKSYYYVKLNYKDPRTDSWKFKTLATGLEVKNNKRKAETAIKDFIDKYSYLEELPAEYNTSVSPNITLSDYLDLWLADKERDLKKSTYEGYAYRVTCIKNILKLKIQN